MWKNDAYDSVPTKDKGFNIRVSKSSGDIAYAGDDSIVSEIFRDFPLQTTALNVQCPTRLQCK